MSMQELVQAGAPELPPGRFYRVRESLHLGYKLEIREQRRFRSRLVVEVFIVEELHADMTEAVVSACSHAYRVVQERAKRRDKFAALAQLAGDHDPKGGRR